MKKNKILLLLLALMMVFSACSGGDDTPSVPDVPDVPPVDNPIIDPEPEPPHDPDAGFDVINPLTGEKVEEDISGKRPYAVMLNNIKKALPQHGITEADIIYEVLAEGGITRMLGVFQDIEDVGMIGSIRSARPYYIDLALSHDAIYIHAGGSTQAYSDLKSKGVTNFDGVNGRRAMKIFYRDTYRRQNVGYEHSMFTTGALIAEHVFPLDIRHDHEEGYEYTQQFKTFAAPLGDDANKITANFISSKSTVFDYDYDSDTYLVSEYDKAYADGNNDEQFAAKNVIILATDVKVIDGKGRRSVRTTGEGDGYFACGGKITPIKWSREGTNDQFVYTLEDGTPLALGRGKSYVCILSDTADVVYE